MKNILVLILFLLAQTAIAQPFNQTDSKGRKIGQWKKVYGNGKVRYTGQFKNDKPIGTFLYYDTNGKLTTEITHSTDGHSSVCKMYYSDNKLRATGFYYDQLKDSLWVYYTEKTSRKALEERYKRGKRHGEWKVYFENEMVFSTITYANDLENGPWIEYYQDGGIHLSAYYVNGLLSGDYAELSVTGDTLSHGTYENGKRQGVWKNYGTDGKIERIEYIRDGWVYKEEIYKNGLLVETKVQATKIKEE